MVGGWWQVVGTHTYGRDWVICAAKLDMAQEEGALTGQPTNQPTTHSLCISPAALTMRPSRTFCLYTYLPIILHSFVARVYNFVCQIPFSWLSETIYPTVASIHSFLLPRSSISLQTRTSSNPQPRNFYPHLRFPVRTSLRPNRRQYKTTCPS